MCLVIAYSGYVVRYRYDNVVSLILYCGSSKNTGSQKGCLFTLKQAPPHTITSKRKIMPIFIVLTHTRRFEGMDGAMMPCRIFRNIHDVLVPKIVKALLNLTITPSILTN